MAFHCNVACHLWGHHWTSKPIQFHCDNQGVVERGYQFPSIKSPEGYGFSRGSNTLHRGSIIFIFEQYMFPGSITTSKTLSLSIPDGALPPARTPSQPDTVSDQGRRALTGDGPHPEFYENLQSWHATIFYFLLANEYYSRTTN